MPLVTEFVFPQAQEGLRHMDTVTESRVGVNRMFQGIDESAINDHNRIGQLSTMAAQRVEDMARLFSHGFRRLFALAHELVIKSGHQEETVRLRGQWVNINPTQWRTGRDMRITAPFAAGNKDALLQRLMVLKGIHAEALAAGLPIVTPEDSYELALEIAKAADVAGDKFFTDPKMIPPPPEPVDHTMIALEIENKKAENEAVDESRKAELEQLQINTDAQIKELVARINSETQIALAQIKAGQQVDLERFKAELKNAPVELDAKASVVAEINESISNSIRQVSDAVAELKATSEAPIKIVRKGGKIVGKEVNGKFIPLEEA